MSHDNAHEPKSILEHIGEFRRKLFLALGALIVGTIIAHVFHREIIAFLLKPAGSNQLIFLSPLEPILFILKIDVIGGIVLSFPIIIWCIFSYISPAFSQKVRKLLTLFYVTSFLLLVISLAYAFFVTVPLSLRFLFSISIPGIENHFSAQSYVSFFITQSLIIMGIFQLPILIVGSVYLGILKTRLLSSKRRYTYLIITIALAILTPTTDIFSLSIVLVPCLVIFEGSLFVGKLIERSRRHRGT